MFHHVRTKTYKTAAFGGLVLFFCLFTSFAFAQTQLPVSAATASSYYYTYTPARTIDNNLSTYWRGASSKTFWWLSLDLGKTSNLTQISIWWRYGYGASNYNIQGSNDNLTWTNLYINLSSVAPSKIEPYQQDFSLSGSYRYIRLYINTAQSSYPVIYEVKLYGSSTTDTTPPTTPTVTDDGLSQVSTTQLHASWSSSDPESGIAEYQYKITQDSTSGVTIVDWSSTGTSNSVTRTGLSLSLNKTYYFQVKARNGVNLWSAIGYSDGITVIASSDTTPPVVSITQPANGATLVGTTSIAATATDNIAVSKVEFYIDDILKATDTTSAYTYSWDTTASTNATHSIKAIAYDTSNNTNQQTISVTVNNPTTTELKVSSATASSYYYIYTPAKAIDNNLSTYWRGASSKTFWWLSLDLGKTSTLNQISIWWRYGYGASNYNIQGSNDSLTWTNLYTGLSSVAPDKTNPYKQTYSLPGSYRYLRLYINKAQTYYPIIYEVKVYGSTITDTTPPTGTIRINNDAQYTNSTAVTLNLSATDNSGGSGLSQMQFSNDNVNWSTAEAYATTKAWTLASGDGTKTVYAKYKDVAGNWSTAVSDTIVLDTIKPTIAITTPQDGVIITDP